MPNNATLHQGMKVRKGVKYIVTQWFRERPLG
jgi:prolyl 4-hydroxylase